MDTLEKLIDISSRLDHLENAAEWISRETVHTDHGVSQTGTLICVLAEELRERLSQVFQEVERALGSSNVN
jgi:hypothetical protein